MKTTDFYVIRLFLVKHSLNLGTIPRNTVDVVLHWRCQSKEHIR